MAINEDGITRIDQSKEQLAGSSDALQTQDLTEQKLMEESHRAFLQTAMDGFWLVDMQGKLLEVNESYCQMSGYDAQELLSKHVWDMETIKAADDVPRHIHQIMTQGEDRWESKHLRKDGTIFFCEVCARYRPIDGGRIIAFLRDITARKHAEEALRQSEEAHKALVNGLPDVVMRFDRQGRHLFVSENICDFGDLQPAQIVGKTHRELGYTEKDCQFWEESMRKVFDSGLPLETEYSFEGKRGTVVRNWRIRPEFDAQGAVCTVLSITRDITAQRQAERNYQTLFCEMINGFALHEIICDEQGNPVDYRFLDVNPAFETMTGLRAEDVIGRSALEVLPGLERYWIEIYGKVALSGEPVFFENYSSELGKYFEVTAFQPRPNQFACIFADITERKHAEEALKKSEEQFRGVIDTLPLAIYITSTTDYASVYMNPTMIKFFGYTKEEIPTLEHWLVLAYPDDQYRQQINNEWARRIDRSIETNIPFEPLDTVVRCKDGSDKVVLWAYINLGDVNYYCGLNQTKTKRAEENLRRSEQRYARAIAATSEAIWERDLTTDQSFYSPRWYEMLGYQDREFAMTFDAWKDLCHPDDFELAIDRIQRTLDSQDDVGYEVEFRMKTKSGEWRWIQGKGNVVERDTDGKPLTLSGTNSDITERKKAEEEKARLEEQLHHAMKMESVGRLAGGVAHDFNNMLGVIIGHAQMALEGVDEVDPIHEDLTEITKAAERSADLTRSLLAFARKQTVIPKVIDINHTIEGMLKMLQRLIGDNIQLNWRPQADLWQVKVDPSQIDQIMANLCVNARDAITDMGFISVQTDNAAIDDAFCATHADFSPGDFVRLTFTDSGCGMDSELLSHIFEPFFTTKGVGEGTGLGLSSVYGAVKQNNGLINVYSELGHGTIFTIYIPRHVGSAEQVHSESVRAPSIRGDETVLLVEDEPAILRMTKMMLERLGYTVITAATPGEATHLAEKHHGEINLLLTDVVMPEMTGRDLAKNLLSLYPHLSRLFMSGYTSDVIAHHGKIDDGVYFIQKPFSMGELSKIVRRALGG
ncbi:MAG: PAS domain S-box protein [Armatimonadota bacterium]